MQFTVDQTLPGTAGEVIDTFTDPAFLASLAELPKVGAPELLDQRRQADEVQQRVRYRFRGELSPTVRRVIDPDRLTWVVERDYDLRAATASFRIVPDHYEGRLRCQGRERYVGDDDGRRTHRRVEGELTVRWPLVGGAIERAIVSGLREHLEEETALAGRWITGRGTDGG